MPERRNEPFPVFGMDGNERHPEPERVIRAES